MNIEQELLDKVELKLVQQNALSAVLGASLWAISGIILWYLVYSYNPSYGSIMLLLNGIFVGLVIRFLGRGMTPLFSVIALLTHSWLTFIAFDFGIVLSGTTWAISIFGLYAAGAGLAMHIARINVPFHEHRAFDYLAPTHAKKKTIKNSWLSTLIALVLAVGLASCIAIFGILFFSEYKNLQLANERQQSDLTQNREIDITVKGLENRPTKEILLYAFAYHMGVLFNEKGTKSQPFNRSKYKANAVLKYLIKYRDNRRAKFILGFLTGGVNGKLLFEEALAQGDEYAKIYSAIEFGCKSDKNLAIKHLNSLRNLFRAEYLRQEIDSILYIGFNDVCSDIEYPEFSLSFVQNYTDQVLLN